MRKGHTSLSRDNHLNAMMCIHTSLSVCQWEWDHPLQKAWGSGIIAWDLRLHGSWRRSGRCISQCYHFVAIKHPPYVHCYLHLWWVKVSSFVRADPLILRSHFLVCFFFMYPSTFRKRLKLHWPLAIRKSPCLKGIFRVILPFQANSPLAQQQAFSHVWLARCPVDAEHTEYHSPPMDPGSNHLLLKQSQQRMLVQK